MGFFEQYWSIEPLVSLMVPLAVMSYRLPRRAHAVLRLALVLVVLLAFAIGPLASGAVTGLTAWQTFAVFSALLGVFALGLWFIFEIRPWTALFCATAGYTMQNLATGLTALIISLYTHHPPTPPMPPTYMMFTVAIEAGVYVAGYFLFVRQVSARGLLNVENRLMLCMFAIVAIMVIGIDVLIKGLNLVGIPFKYFILLRLVHPLICMFVLFSEYEILAAKQASDELVETEHLLAERERQYQLSRENIEAINIKCHDIRHQIRHLQDGHTQIDKEVLADIAREVSVFDAAVETGNEALDTILTEKSLACASAAIGLTVIADGAALNHMAPADIYSFFGNMLDNAMEACKQIDDPQHRAITLSVKRRGQMVAISCENSCNHVPAFKDGLPITTKSDRNNHGFGMRSMRAIAQRYGGTLHTGVKEQVFYLNALIAQKA